MFLSALKFHAIAEFLVEAVKKTIEVATHKGGDMVVSKIEKMLTQEIPRPLLLELINGIIYMEKISNDDAKMAIKNLNSRLQKAREEGCENRMVRALCRILFLDPINEKGEYTSGHNKAQAMLAVLGLMDEENFSEAIEFLVDDPFMEMVRTASVKGRKMWAIIAEKIYSGKDTAVDFLGALLDEAKKFPQAAKDADAKLAKKIAGDPQKLTDRRKLIQEHKDFR